jgi:hypothetical protein
MSMSFSGVAAHDAAVAKAEGLRWPLLQHRPPFARQKSPSIARALARPSPTALIRINIKLPC